MEALLSLTVLALPLLARGFAETVQRRARLAVWRGLEPAPADDAFRGFKIAQLIVGPTNDAWLAGITSLRYGVDELARCRRRGCRPPGLDCRCGFYAFRDRDRALALLTQLAARHPARTYVLLTVDLDGHVLEYELGFRAQRQRVLRIELPTRCSTCRRQGNERQAVTYLSHSHFRGEQLLYERTLSARMALPVGSAPIRPVCGEHLPDGPVRQFTLLDLRGLTGTEVVQLPAADEAREDGTAAA